MQDALLDLRLRQLGDILNAIQSMSTILQARSNLQIDLLRAQSQA